MRRHRPVAYHQGTRPVAARGLSVGHRHALLVSVMAVGGSSSDRPRSPPCRNRRSRHPHRGCQVDVLALTIAIGLAVFEPGRTLRRSALDTANGRTDHDLMEGELKGD